MPRIVKILVAAVLLGSLTIQADPFKMWNWTPSTEYMDGTPIPSTDIQSWTLHCSNMPGSPYEVDIAITGISAPPSEEDMWPIVQGMPGDYVCILTQHSRDWDSDSPGSNEIPFLVTPDQVGKVPAAITDLRIVAPPSQ